MTIETRDGVKNDQDQVEEFTDIVASLFTINIDKWSRRIAVAIVHGYPDEEAEKFGEHIRCLIDQAVLKYITTGKKSD